MKAIGIDSGSTTTKGVLLENGQIIQTELLPTGGTPKEAMEAILSRFSHQSKIPVVTTGYGRKLIQADKSLTEITCHAKGAKWLAAETRNIIDIGGQDCKAIRLDALGAIEEFNMNDKCAAGTGRFIEVMLRTLGENISAIDSFVENAHPVKINSMCTVFAESEIISLISKGEARNDIALGVLHSICSRVANQFARVSPSQKGIVFFSGGPSNSEAIRTILSHYIKRPVETHPLAQYTGAIGAAILAEERVLT
ncbi:acyl-CoA dehydratase activase [Listeria ilorinensis]|uniref:acyl-CoA dehydratase activase n=1 Tax=Listeria ilorinensis TaxID=2867439 RepID=UPI001EF67706|nr:acyl-CoA dehydratase activase [Listeria ilorinensis]